MCVRARTPASGCVPIGTAQGDLSADLAEGETPPPVTGGKTHANAICTGPRSKEEKKRRDKQENIQKWPRLHILTS